MLRITQHSGFHMKFRNGWTASVQFGPGTYCTPHHYNANLMEPSLVGLWESPDAEVAAWPADGDMIALGCDTVKGFLCSDQVLAFLNWVASADHELEALGAVLHKEEMP